MSEKTWALRVLCVVGAIQMGQWMAGALAACSAPATPHPPTCSDACDHARELHCSIGDPTPAGATCEDVCASVEAMNLHEARWPIACVLNADTCSEIERCH
jgi:hypothetical protein